MKTIFDSKTREEVLARINTLNEDSHAEWGEMTTYQMIRHCIKWEEMLLGKTIYRQSFLGRLVGKFALKDMMKDEPAKHNLPTVPSFKMTGHGDVAPAKAEWISLIHEHEQREGLGFVHPFFGQLTADQAGRMAYKHVDHHLRQFNS
ncbi:DUF1569 domain-containing protein [Mucilaginibacter sp. BJC16-A38]|uniref:DUF1569 domain-containing protein n=1 Tax=Mucilaginibacter phenanthrenivorans TaxID=1234842 RepID=UPI0021579191|nr:DUF1569 domain-containing protein [Mucilaginibacter phenanthrenivorans]MCR8559589.1 DUF1569 domain-containing protein [Mucilaginibacter phenanthrenivorans]